VEARDVSRRVPGVFFTNSEASRAAGQQVAGRAFEARTADRDAPTSWQTRLVQDDAVCAWGQPNHSLLERVSAIDKPVLVVNGDSDPMILQRHSYLLAGLIRGATEDLLGRSARLPLPTPRRVRRRRRCLPGGRMSAADLLDLALSRQLAQCGDV
jgi:hypothetical protein